MAWTYLAIAIIVEVAATCGLKASEGLTNRGVTALIITGYVVSYVAMAQGLKAGLEVSVGYAIWSGAGTAAVAVIGALWFREPASWVKIVAIALIIAGVALLNLAPTSASAAARGPSTSITLHPAASLALADALNDLTSALHHMRQHSGVDDRRDEGTYRRQPTRVGLALGESRNRN
ncbi:UNVERIFIED_ORG: small multidrug resistance pump [Microbispora rosea subsp. rosea]